MTRHSVICLERGKLIQKTNLFFDSHLPKMILKFFWLRGCKNFHTISFWWFFTYNFSNFIGNFLSGICCDVPRKFELQWVVDNTEAFQEILVDATMVGDHFPDVLAKNLKRMHDMYCSGVTSSVWLEREILKELKREIFCF